MEKLKANYLKLIESYRNSIIKLKFTKEQTTKMEEQVKELSAENAKLSVRAAVGLSNLTPRPSVDPVSFSLKFCLINFNKVVGFLWTGSEKD